MVPTLVLKERKPQGNLVKVWDGLYFSKTSEQHHKDRMKADHKTLLIKKKKILWVNTRDVKSQAKMVV